MSGFTHRIGGRYRVAVDKRFGGRSSAFQAGRTEPLLDRRFDDSEAQQVATDYMRRNAGKYYDV